MVCKDHQHTYDVPANSIDEVVRIANSTMIEAFHHYKEDGLACLVALIICIRGGRIAQQYGKDSIKGKLMVQP